MSHPEHAVRRHARNSFFIALARAFQIGSGMALLVILTRYLSVENYGWYAYIVSLVTLIVTMTNLGLNQVLVREIAKDEPGAAAHFGHALTLRLLLVLAAGALLAGASPFLDMPLFALTALGLGYCAESLRAVSQLFASIYQAYERTQYDPLLTLVQNLVFFALLALIILMGLDLPWVFGALCLSLGLQLALSLRILAKRFILPKAPASPAALRPMLRDSLTLGLGNLLYQNIFYINTILLKWLVDPMAVSYFQLPNDFLFKFQILPFAILQAVFPAMARSLHADREQAVAMQRALFRYAVLLVLPVTLYLAFFSEEIVTILFGAKYAPAAPILRILSFAAAPMVLDMILSLILVGLNKQHYMIYYAGGTLALVIAANFTFVPRFTYLASAYIASGSYVFLFVCVAVTASRFGVRPFSASALVKCLAAAGIALGLMILTAKVSLLLAFALGAPAYLATALALGVLPKADLREIKGLVMRRKDLEAQKQPKG